MHYKGGKETKNLNFHQSFPWINTKTQQAILNQIHFTIAFQKLFVTILKVS